MRGLLEVRGEGEGDNPPSHPLVAIMCINITNKGVHFNLFEKMLSSKKSGIGSYHINQYMSYPG